MLWRALVTDTHEHTHTQGAPHKYIPNNKAVHKRIPRILASNFPFTLMFVIAYVNIVRVWTSVCLLPTYTLYVDELTLLRETVDINSHLIKTKLNKFTNKINNATYMTTQQWSSCPTMSSRHYNVYRLDNKLTQLQCVIENIETKLCTHFKSNRYNTITSAFTTKEKNYLRYFCSSHSPWDTCLFLTWTWGRFHTNQLLCQQQNNSKWKQITRMSTSNISFWL